MRDLEGYRDTRYQLLVLRPAQKASWIGYAMSFHLLKDYDMALKILEEFRKTQPVSVKPYDYEHSEMLLYQNQVMVEAGMEEEALQHLNDYEKQTVDKLSILETKAKLFLKLGRLSEAADIYQDLINRNPEYSEYYSGLEESLHPATFEDRLAIYQKVSEKFPKALAPKRLPLEFISGDLFRSTIDKYLTHALHKGIPPLFKTLRSLYSDPDKVVILEEMILNYVEALKSHELFHIDDMNVEKESPTSLLWSYYYLAQHYDHLRQYDKALEFINTALEHTMTLIELYVIKAKILKHAGDIYEAVRCLDEAQSLDTADRYINSKCAKYMLRANLLKEAEDMCSKFTREGISAAENLHEMQCMWFELECAALYQRLGKYGEALKKCHEIDRHFAEIIEDQFDFHTYCMRKMTLRSYVELLRLEDVLRNHTSYYRATKMAIEIYLHLYDHPVSDEATNKEQDQENLTPAEQRKLKSKQRKKAMQEAQKKEEKQRQQQQQQQNKTKVQDPELEGPKEEELNPDKLIKPDHPFEEAIRFLKPLQFLAGNRVETHVFAFRIYSRRGKLLLMLQSLKRGRLVDPNNPQLHECLMEFLETVKKQTQLPEIVQKVLSQEMLPLFGDKDAASLNLEFLDHFKNSLPHQVAGAKMLYHLDPLSQAKCIALATTLSPEIHERTVLTCTLVLESLKNGDFGSCEAEAENYRMRCKAVFPHATIFASTTPNGVDSEKQEISDFIGFKEIKDGLS